MANYGTLAGANRAGAALYEGGLVTNGSAIDQTAQFVGGYEGVPFEAAAGTVINFGSIKGGDGADLLAGGYVVNGAQSDTGATIQGNIGVIGSGAGSRVPLWSDRRPERWGR